MHHIHARLALLPDGWTREVRIGMESGVISSIDSASPPQPDDDRVEVLIPGIPNLHSHAFQRGMAGLTEPRGAAADLFWIWRARMYQFALSMTPDQMERMAALAYIEMLEAGFTRVGEFHYLHHDMSGAPYADIAEMTWRIASAASATGIALTLLPVFYAHADFGGQPPADEQRRFVNTLDSFARLHERSGEVARRLDRAVVGIAPHSLRAVTPDELSQLVAMQTDGPIHIHVAEQIREVEGCRAWSGSRPVELLLDTFEVDDRWCLIHATHMTTQETERLAASGAVAGLCPVTEAYLGDGIFEGLVYTEKHGRYGVGTDSNVAIDAAAELRQLEYSQRLQHRARVMAACGSTGRALVDAARTGGSIALGTPDQGISTGAPADLVALDSDVMELSDGETALNAWIFTESVDVSDVWAGGRHVVKHGRHIDREGIQGDFRTTMHQLAAHS